MPFHLAHNGGMFTERGLH